MRGKCPTHARINEPATGKPNRKAGKNVIIHRLLSFGIEPYEIWQLLFLLFSATVYVAAAVALYMCFNGATQGRPGTAAAIGASVSSTLWISAIAFAIRKANVVETSLMFAYVVFNIYQVNTSLLTGADPLAGVRAFKANRAESGVPLVFNYSTTAVLDYIIDAVEHSLDFLTAANAVLPTMVIVSLVYRMAVLYSAIRVLPSLRVRARPDPKRDALWRKRNQAWSEQRVAGTPESSGPVTPKDMLLPSASASEDEKSAAADLSRALSMKEPESPDTSALSPPAAAPQASPRPKEAEAATDSRPDGARANDGAEHRSPLISGLALYSRFVLIAVYSHLLLLDQNHQIYWRLLTVVFTLAMWSVELLLSKEDASPATVYE